MVTCVRKEVVNGISCVMGQVDNREQYKIGVYQQGQVKNYFQATSKKEADTKFDMLRGLLSVF